MTWRSVAFLLAKILYWAILVLLLLFFPALQSWDALPEGEAWKLLGYAVLAAALLLPALTWRRKTLHFVTVGVLLLAGGCLFLLNQGVLREPASAADVEILIRAGELLADESRWDRSSSRDCEEDSASLTLYCALRRASYEKTGGFRHRRPAMQAVREQIGTARPGARYAHRLAGFNSDPDVNLEAVHRLLEESAVALRARGGLG